MIGFKVFDYGLINRYGFKYELNKTYHTDGELRFGIDGNGFHMCKNIEDTLRYFDAFNDNIRICLKVNFYSNDNILKCIKYYQENNEDVYKLIK